MPRVFKVTLLLVISLAGCNVPLIPTEAVPVSDGQDSSMSSLIPGETVEATQTPFDASSILTSSITVEGVLYTAWQVPGDPFRFVCQSPCQLSEDYIHAEYAGFRPAHARLIQILGIDTLPELQPVDMHLELMDSICSELPVGHAYIYADSHQAYTCSEGPGYYPTWEEKIQMASQMEGQYFPLHEYMHTIFFGRLSGQAGDFVDYRAAFFHDYVVPVPSFAIGILDPSVFCTFYTGKPTGDYGGWLISELCQRNGFELDDLATSLIMLDGLYQSGNGQIYQEGYEHPAATLAQYRDILNDLLGSDTTPAFAAACWPPELFDNNFTSPAGCRQPTAEGTSTPIK